MPHYLPEDSLQSPRFTGIPTFARLPYVRTLEDVDLAVIGVPFDTATTYRTGGRFGPNAVRSAAVMLRPFNPAQEVNPFEILSCVDYGDIAIVPGSTPRSYEAIEREVAPVVEAGVIPLLIGGDHACTLPHLRATRSKGPVAVIMFDSHTDAWDTHFGEKYTHGTSFAASDHRSYNRHGEAFDVGETFSGVDFDTGVDAAREFAALVPAGATPAQAALRWVIQQPGVTTVIPGARSPGQARQNAAAAALPPLPAAELGAIKDIYDRRIRAQVQDRW